MGYAYSVYAVDLKKLRPSKDKKLFAAIRAKQADDWAEADRWFDRSIVERGAPIRARALWELLYGKPGKQFGFQYGYALESLCQHFGERVDEISLTWFDDVLDPLLRKARAPTTKRLLCAGTRPMKFPAPADFPEIGTVAPAACAAGIRTLASLQTDNDNARMVIDEVSGWFEKAKAKKRGLVWFVY